MHALDLRNHGQSPWSDDVGYEAMAGDVLGYLDSQNISRAAIIGHSMGGKVAMAAALHRPDRIERMLVADIAPVQYPSAFGPYIKAMRSLDLSAIKRRSEAGELLEQAVPDPGIRAFLVQNLGSGPSGFAWRINLAALDIGMPAIQGFPEQLLDGQFDGPTLFLGGKKSDYIRSEHRAVIKRNFPQARVAYIPGAGHWLHAEKPDAFTRNATAFLAA